MSYDTLKEASWLIDEELEKEIRQKSAQKELSPGECFREATKQGLETM